MPIFAVASESDHIAPWKSSFTGLSKTSGEKQFVLAESGHIAGVVNPPCSGKYGYWLNPAPIEDPDEWQKAGEHHKGSWWEHWSDWLAEHSGKKVPARKPGKHDFPALCAAPGTYVVAKRKKSTTNKSCLSKLYTIYAALQHFLLEMPRCGMYICLVISALLPNALQKLNNPPPGMPPKTAR